MRRACRFDDFVAVPGEELCGSDAGSTALLQLYRDKLPLLAYRGDHDCLYRVVPELGCSEPHDPHLQAIVDRMFAISLEDASSFRWEVRGRSGRRFLLSLYHTWALWTWSRWLAALDAPPNAVTVLHIDAHDDLAAPSLSWSGAARRWTTPIANSLFDLYSPDHVEAAIERGFVGIGSFIVPLLATLDQVTLIHFDPSRDEERVCERWALELHEDDVTLAVGSYRRLLAWKHQIGKWDAAPLRLLVTGSASEALEALRPDDPVLVDVDLDACSNWYEDRIDDSPPSELEHMRMLARLACIRDVLGHRSVVNHCTVLTIALSPNFFPARYWQVALESLAPAFRQILFRGRGSAGLAGWGSRFNAAAAD